MEIGEGKNAVPDATGARSAVILAPTATGRRRNDCIPYVSGDVTLSPGGCLTATPSAKSRAHACAITWSGLIFGLSIATSALLSL